MDVGTKVEYTACFIHLFLVQVPALWVYHINDHSLQKFVKSGEDILRSWSKEYMKN